MTVNVMFVTPDVGDRLQVFDRGIPTMSDPGVHDATAIVAVIVLGQQLGQSVPVASREVRQQALVPLGLPRFPAAVPAG